jgi:hypothetical protein
MPVCQWVKNPHVVMKELIEAWRSVDRNKIAMLLSVVPGAGHLYKHHYVAGFGILTAGNALMVFASVLLALATAGFSLILVPAAYVAAVAYSAHEAEDWHGKHKWMHVWEGSWFHRKRA